MGADALYIGMDIGGTELKAALASTDGSIIAEQMMRTPAEEGREGIVRGLRTLTQRLLEKANAPVRAIGIGSAGKIDAKTGSIAYSANIPGWTGTLLAKEMSEASGLPAFVDNDVNAAALGEAWVGAVRGEPSFAFVAIGTGVGGAIIEEGRVMHGSTGGAGEIGHMIVHPGGLPCGCGQAGCFELYASGTALGRLARAIDPAWDSRSLMEHCRSGDPRAVRAVEQFADDLALGIISLWNLTDPGVIVIGGGLVSARDVWQPHLDAALQRRAGRNREAIRLVPAALGNRAGILGAARLAMQRSES